MLIVKGQDKVILHMPKCAGSSVRWAVIKQYPDYRWSCEHAPVDAIPERYRDFKRIGFCRSPRTWYISKYFHDREQNKRGPLMDTLSLVNILSNGFGLSFEQTLPRLLDVQNFFEISPDHLKQLKVRLRQLEMNKYLCRISATYPDLSELSAADFKPTLYDYWYNLVGLNTATVYKMDDQHFSANVNKEFPGVKVGRRNIGKVKEPLSNKSFQLIVKADNQYFEKYKYSRSAL